MTSGMCFLITGAFLHTGASQGPQDQRVADVCGARNASHAGKAVGSGCEGDCRLPFDITRPAGIHVVGRQISDTARCSCQPDKVLTST